MISYKFKSLFCSFMSKVKVLSSAREDAYRTQLIKHFKLLYSVCVFAQAGSGSGVSFHSAIGLNTS